MIRTLVVEAFKSLLDVRVELGRVNVFVGANGSGKTNLLEALGVLGAAAGGRVDDEALLHRGVRPGVPGLYKSSFRGRRRKSAIRLEAFSPDASYKVSLYNPIANPRPAWTYRHELVEQGAERLVGRSPASRGEPAKDPHRGFAALKAVDWDPGSPASRLLSELSRYAIYAPSTNALRGLISDPQSRAPVGLAGGRLPEAVRELQRLGGRDPRLARVWNEIMELIDWAEGCSVRPVGSNLPLSPSVSSSPEVLYFKDRFMARSQGGLTGYDASEGALYVLFAAALAALPGAPSLLAIDNFDHGLNPRLARALMHRICEWVLSQENRQILLTSHNPLVLDGLPLEDERVRLFAVARSRKGSTRVTRIELDLGDLRREGELWTVSRLWVMGHLGGMPDV
jgi:energy-coupling factor transporter ATP-binding protein EcfA2